MHSIKVALLALLFSLAAWASDISQPASASPYLTLANAASTGTTVNTLTIMTGAPSTAVIATTASTGGVVGITVAGAGTTGNATIQILGQAACVFSGATTAGDYVQISGVTGGDCVDAGGTYPTSGGQVIGRVLSTNGGAGTYQVDLFPAEIQPGSGGGSGTVTSVSFTGGIISVATPTTTPAFTVAGTSGGIPYFASGSTWASSAQLPSGDFVLGGGAGGAPTATFATVPISKGGTNATSAAAGTVPNATSGTAASWTPTITLGASGTLGSVTMGNATSGTVTIQPVTGALGTVTASLPANSGTIAEINLAQTFSALQTLSAGINLSSTGSPLQFAGSAGSSGQCAISGGAATTPSWGSCGSTAGVTSFSGDGTIITNSGSTGAVTATIAGTSGGVPYFSSVSAWASSAAGTVNDAMLWGGAGAAPKDSGIPYVTACGTFQCAVGTLTSVQLLALSTTAVSIIGAAGAGNTIQIDELTFEGVYGGTAYTFSGNIFLKYAAAGTVITGNCASGILTSTANAVCMPVVTAIAALVSTDYVNTAVQIAASSALTLGNGTLNYWVKYHILTGF